MSHYGFYFSKFLLGHFKKCCRPGKVGYNIFESWSVEINIFQFKKFYLCCHRIRSKQERKRKAKAKMMNAIPAVLQPFKQWTTVL